MVVLWTRLVADAETWRRRAWLFLALTVAGMAGLATLLDSSPPFLSGSTATSLVPAGLFVGSQTPSDVLSLGQRLGVSPSIMTVYADGSCYCTYSDPPSTSMTLMLGVGALTNSQATSIGQSLVADGQSSAIIRIMWEQNQDVSGWFQDWNQLTFTAAEYISTFQSIVTAMRSVPGQAFRFMWNPNGGTGNEASGRTWQDTWPGQAYVNYVGVDQYDYSGYAANIQAIVSFAQSQGLQPAIPEWGLDGSDDPSYINGVASLVNNPANNFALQAYFSYDGGSGGIDSDITEFPQSEAAFVVDFGGSGNPSPVTTTSTPSSSTTTSPPASTTTTSTPSSSSPAPHVMVVMMENQGSSQVIGNPAMPYTNGLASTYGSATQSFALAHPSLPNYLALVSGSAQGVTTDQDPSSGTFPDTETLAGQLAAAGISEAAYAEDLPADPTNDSGNYFVHHNPWEYFPNAPISVENSTSLVGDLNSRNAPDFVWYTPNALDDGDGESTEASSIAGEESFLSSFIPTVQATSWYQAGGQIIIEWDEALASDTTGINGGAGGHVPTIVVSDALGASPQQDSTLVDTVGILRSIEDTYDLSYLGGSAADGTIDALLNASVTPTTTTTTTTTTRPPPPPPTTTAPPPPTTTTTRPQPPTTTTTAPPPTTTTTTTRPRPPTTTTTAPRPQTTTTTAPPPPPPTTTTTATTTPTSPTTTTPTPPTPEPTATTVSVSPEPGSSAQGLTAVVSPAPDEGSVQFVVDGWVVGDAVSLSSDGSAVIALYLANGPHLVQAVYSGDPWFGSSSSASVVDVGQIPTTLVVSPPALVGPGQLYNLNASLTSGGLPVPGASVWFSAAGSALCVSTTDATGVATCSIDEGATDAFSLASAGDLAAFGGDTTHGPTSAHSPVPGGNDTSSVAEESSTSPPVTPSSALATDTPAILDADDTALFLRTGGGITFGLFTLIGMLGLLMVCVSSVTRRRLLRAEGSGLRR